MQASSFGAIGVMSEAKEDPIKYTLGEGIVLAYLGENNKYKYGLLFRGNQKLSDKVFRVGGLGGKFKDGYCQLIHYPNFKDKGNLAEGNHCIVDTTGKIVLTQEGLMTSPYHLKGVIATMNKKYYNLLTGEVITEGYSNVRSENFVFVENIDGVEKFKHQKRVYKIDYRTGSFEIFV